MIQLSFQPAFDPFHTVFRLLRLRSLIAESGPLARDAVRILDYYLLFPFRIDKIRLFQKHRGFRALAKAFKDAEPYSELPDDKVLLERMRLMQEVALDTLAQRNWISDSELVVGKVAATDVSLPSALRDRIYAANADDKQLLDFLLILATEYDFLGSDGLKARTHLLEHRYDAI